MLSLSDLSFLAVPLPEDLQRLKAFGDFEGLERAIASRLCRELPLALLRQYSERFGEDVYAAVALTNCVTGRTSLGGTCVASVEAQIASVRDFLAGQTEAAKQVKNG